MHLLAVLQQTGPVFLLELLLAQDEGHIPRCMMRLRIFDVDFGVEFQFDVVGSFLAIGVAGEG